MIPTEMLPDEGGYLGLYSRFPVLPFRPSGSSVVPVVLMIDMIPNNKTLVERSNQIS